MSAVEELKDILRFHGISSSGAETKQLKARVFVGEDLWGTAWFGFPVVTAHGHTLVLYRRLSDAEHRKRMDDLMFLTLWEQQPGFPEFVESEFRPDDLFAEMEFRKIWSGMTGHLVPSAWTEHDGVRAAWCDVPNYGDPRQTENKIVMKYRRATPEEMAAPDPVGPRYWKRVGPAEVIETE